MVLLCLGARLSKDLLLRIELSGNDRGVSLFVELRKGSLEVRPDGIFTELLCRDVRSLFMKEFELCGTFILCTGACLEGIC
jgi:hypothetical protein